MVRKLLGSGLVVIALLAFSAAIDIAEARRGGHGHGGHFSMGGGHHFAVRHVRSARVFFHHRAHFRRFHRFHRRVFIGGVYGYRHRCAWLRHRAIVTGSPYWWHRYWRCRHGYRY